MMERNNGPVMSQKYNTTKYKYRAVHVNLIKQNRIRFDSMTRRTIGLMTESRNLGIVTIFKPKAPLVFF